MTIATVGELDLPEGVLVIVDPGLGSFWRHHGDPRLPHADVRDLAIVGDDAESAGRAYDHELDPFFLFDCADPEEARVEFDAFARERGLRAHAEVLAERVSSAARLSSALVAGQGLGVVRHDGRWVVVASGLPRDRVLSVEAAALDDGEFAGRLAYIDVVAAHDPVARVEHVTGVMSDSGWVRLAAVAPRDDGELDGAQVDTGWGDGIYDVSRHLDDAGGLLRIRIELGTEARLRMLRQVTARRLGAIVTRSIARDREPIRFAERYPPANGRDSGWCFASGVEDDDDMEALSVVSVASVLAGAPELDEVLGAEIGARYRRDGDRFVIDDGAEPVDA